MAVRFKVTVNSGEEAHRVAREWRAAGLPEYALWIHKADTADRRVRSGPADVDVPDVTVSGTLVIDLVAELDYAIERAPSESAALRLVAMREALETALVEHAAAG